jgi:FdhD protein
MGGGLSSNPEEQEVICEAPVTLFVNEQEIVTLMTLPVERSVLAAGFLFSEGWIRVRDDIVRIQEDAEQGIVRIQLKELPPIADRFWEKRLIGSGCGKATSFYRVMDAMQCEPVSSSYRVHVSKVLSWMRETLKQAPLYGRTRGTHAVSLYGENGKIFFEQDIGRHNALDRILGKCFLKDISAENTVMLTTGRLSSEMIVKAARLGVPVLVSRSSTTTLAIELAERLNLTVLGYLRAGRLSLYTHPQRILEDA